VELADYVKLLQKNREEVDRLYESLLINVTEFFRDAEYFDFLRDTILPEIIERRRGHMPIRVWVPGCSTGEEAYSIGMLLHELLEQKNVIVPVQIFGTDVSDRAIAHARAGLFSAADVANVNPERLKRFFYKTERGYVIQKPIRDMCIFARQNVAKDSPFSRLDLISCRNLLIYLSPKLQRKVMPIFHYALNADGCLMLGNSESVGTHLDLYRLIDRRFRIYSRRSTNRRTNFEFSVDHRFAGTLPPPRPTPAMTDDLKEPFDIIREADRIVLHRHGPIGVLVNEDLEILQFRGDVTPYLAPVPGRASLNLIKMAREGLSGELQSVTQEAREKNIRVHRSGVCAMQGDVAKSVDIDVTPIETLQTKERFFLVLFSPGESPTPGAPAKPETKGKKVAGSQAHVDQLRLDLQATRSYLQATIEKHEATNQELRAANEEIQSSNEELQSTNEELETAKEELQSTNEELTTVNEELHSRQLELIQLNNDLNNLINSVHLPIIILGQDMRIRRFTPMAEKVLNVIPSDIGRPLSDLNINLNIANLPALMLEVVDTLTLKELEVQDTNGRWYSMRLRPYKTAENKIEGVVLTLIDIDQMKRTISQLEEAKVFSQAVIETIAEPMAVLTGDFRVRNANDAFARLFHLTRESIQDRSLFDAMRDNAGIREVRKQLDGVIPDGAGLTDYKVSVDVPGVGPSTLLVSGRRIVTGTRSYPLILLSLRVVQDDSGLR
jgi:two-component system CheB/CheR fusion protein